MFNLNHSPIDIRQLTVKSAHQLEKTWFVLFYLKCEIELETRDQTLEAITGYSKAITSLFEQAQGWGEKEYLDLGLKLDAFTQGWGFILQHEEEDPLPVEIRAAHRGTPKLRLQPQGDTKLLIELESTVEMETYTRIFRLMGPGQTRVYTFDVQHDLFSTSPTPAANSNVKELGYEPAELGGETAPALQLLP